MAPKKPTGSSSAATTSSSKASKTQSYPELVASVWNNYIESTPQRTKLLDVFLAFLLAVGAVQFVYCVVAGNYPFNAFLSGFGATVGQFVLTAALRIQSDPGNLKTEFKSRSQERYGVSVEAVLVGLISDFTLGLLRILFWAAWFCTFSASTSSTKQVGNEEGEACTFTMKQEAWE